jgi:3-oxoacyl-[acyl-carrier-protein] synthase-1
MTGMPLAITGVGMVTGVGLNAPASCAAIRGTTLAR